MYFTGALYLILYFYFTFLKKEAYITLGPIKSRNINLRGKNKKVILKLFYFFHRTKYLDFNEYHNMNEHCFIE